MKEEEILKLERSFADSLKKLRLELDLTVTEMANANFVDKRTWQKYEDAKSFPTVIEYVQIFARFKKNAFRAVLDFIYPDVYQGVEVKDINNLRDAIVHYFQNVASDRMIRQWCFILFGDHGSSPESQTQEFVAIEQLALRDRCILSTLVLNLYEMTAANRSLAYPDAPQPDIALLAKAIDQGKKAVCEGRNSYTIIND